MNITWYGLSCFHIQDKTRDAEVSLVIDPYAPEAGKKLPRSLSADIVLVSRDNSRHNYVSAVGGQPFVIDTPGEFEVKGVTVTGVSTYNESEDGKEKGNKNLFYVNINGVHMLFLGDLQHQLEDKHFKDMHAIDVLFLPVGGQDVLTPKQAVDLVGQLEPRVIVPMHYRTPKLAPKSEPVSVFLKEIGAEAEPPLAKLKLAKKDLPQEEMKIIVLDPQ